MLIDCKNKAWKEINFNSRRVRLQAGGEVGIK